MDGWADSVDIDSPSFAVGPLRLIVSQMNALMNPHYITRLVCEEERGRRAGRQAGGWSIVHIEEEDEEETDRCVYRGTRELLILSEADSALTSAD